MSNVGQVALTVVGTVVGAYFGNPQLGFMLGSLAGQTLFPTKLPGQSGPRLSDMRTTSAVVGGPVFEVFGTDAVPGTVIFMDPVREVATSEEVGGKGGPSQETTTFSYYQTIAVGLCRGVKLGIIRIWENGALMYDARPQQPGESDQTFDQRIAAAGTYAEGFVFYAGTEDQLPDPTIELSKGVGTTVAYRGLCYIVFPNRQLKPEQGLRHPNFKFEVASEQVDLPFVYSNEVLHDWNEGALDPSHELNVNTYRVDATGNNSFRSDWADFECNLPTEFPTMTAALSAATAEMGRGFGVVGYAMNPGDAHWGDAGLLAQMGGYTANQFNRLYAYAHANSYPIGASLVYDYAGPPGVDQLEAAFPDHDQIVYMDHYFTSAGCGGLGGTFQFTSSGLPDGWDFVVSGSGGGWAVSTDALIQITRAPGPPEGDGWERIEGPTFHVLRVFSTGGGPDGGPVKPLNPCVTSDDPTFDDETFWTAAYDQAVIDGDMVAGLTFGVDYPVEQTFAWRRHGGGEGGADGNAANVAAIVTQICERCQPLVAADLDVTALASSTVRGYTLTRVMSGRDALEPLRLATGFDAVESGQVIKFVRRGGAIVRTLTTAQMGAFEYGGQPGPMVKNKWLQETDLPRTIRIHYRSWKRDYEDGEQISPTRSTARTANDMDIEVPIALTDDAAAQIAEILWIDSWEARVSHEIQLSARDADLEPTDPVEVPIAGFLERCRIITIDDSLPLLRKLALVRDFADGYVSRAVADPPHRAPGAILILIPSELLILDLPALRFSEDDEAGVYMTVRPDEAGVTWRGAQIMRSVDGGSTFSALTSVATQPTTGTLLGAIPPGDPATWDTSTTIDVQLRTGNLETRSEADVLTGANTIAVGAHGRWELLQFVTVEQTGPDTFRLSRLLRGRRGTEHVMGSSVIGDTFVLVSGGGLVRVPMEPAAIGEDIIYKAITFGLQISQGVDTTFATTAEALRPFSPASLELAIDEDTNWTLLWVRRDRLGQTLHGELPMSDPPETYEVDVERQGSPQVLVRTLTSHTTSVDYTAAQQAEDFGEATVPVVLRVHQINADVGRGPGTELIPMENANALGLGAIEFIANYDDQPLIIGRVSGRWIFTRRGKQATTPVVGIYGWDGTNPAAVFDTDYDARGGGYVPSSYFAGAVIGSAPLVPPARDTPASASPWAMYWRNNPGGSTRRMLIAGNDDGAVTITAPTVQPLSGSGRDVIGVAAAGAYYYALTAAVGITSSSPLRLWRSADGGAWTDQGDVTGDMPTLTHLDLLEFYEFGGDLYAFCPFGPIKNTDGILVDWDSTSYTNLLAAIAALYGGGAQSLFKAYAVSATSVVIFVEAGTGDLGAVDRRNLILRSTDGESWTVVRNVLKSADIATPFAFNLEWIAAVQFGAGFIGYGKAATAAAFPYALVSTDDGATWSLSAVDTGDPTSNAVVRQAVSDGSTILAIDTYATRTMDAEGEPLPGGTPVVYGRLSTSTDGLTFTALPGFPTA